MKEKGAKDVFQHDEDFLTWLAQEAYSERSQEFLRSVEQGPHPTDDMLFEYVCGGLDEQDAGIIRDHIAFCEVCAEEVLRLRLVQEELEERLLDWANGEDILLTSPYLPSMEELKRGVPQGEIPAGKEDISLPPSKGDLFEELAPEIWEPQWIEQRATAADLPEQKHVFRRPDGEITVSCFWRGTYRNKPAYISISWKADITTCNELRARFINPETREQLAEVYLGTCTAGEEVFTSDDLGFDPSQERWAMTLIVKEVNA